jgi:hypothetical protein
MDGLALTVLKDTLNRVTELTKTEGSCGMLDCVTAVQGYTELCEIDPTNVCYPQKLRRAMADLAGIVEAKQQYLLANRLMMIASLIPPAHC